MTPQRIAMSVFNENELRQRIITASSESGTSISNSGEEIHSQSVTNTATSSALNSSAGSENEWQVPANADPDTTGGVHHPQSDVSNVSSAANVQGAVSSEANANSGVPNQAEANNGASAAEPNRANQPAANQNVIQINFQIVPPRIALGTNYARVSSRMSRSMLESVLLGHALLALIFLIYVQQRFLASPIDCIEQLPSFRRYVDELELQGLPLRDYVVRVHAQYGASQLNLDAAKSVALERLLLYEPDTDFHELLHSINSHKQTNDSGIEFSSQEQEEESQTETEDTRWKTLDFEGLFPMAIFEYSNVVGYLQLSHEARARLNVTVLFFALDLSTTGERCCVRSTFERALFDWLGVLDYDELVLAALKTFVTSAAHLQLTAELPYKDQMVKLSNTTNSTDQHVNVTSNQTDLPTATETETETSASMENESETTGESVIEIESQTEEEVYNEEEEDELEHSNSVRLGRGYIKNVLRSELYQLVPGLTLSRVALFVPFTVMLVFTGAVSMLLQYARSQLYMLYFSVFQLLLELVRNGLQMRPAFVVRRRGRVHVFPQATDAQGAHANPTNATNAAQGDAAANVNAQESPNGPAAFAAPNVAPRTPGMRRRMPFMMVNAQLPPAVNVILAFIGVQAMMIEFFDTELTALCVMMLVWMSDEYLLLLRSARGRSEWLKCFYLCHFLVYAFHYRFSGHYTELALYASFAWMLFFMIRVYHSYELPLFIVRRQPPPLNVPAAR